MGIIFEVIKDGEKIISLSKHSIKNIKFLADTDVTLDPKFNDITRDIILRGDINADKTGEEIDSVRLLANWAIVPEYCECYCDATVKITNARGDLVKEEKFKDMFVVNYIEKFDDDSGHGDFYIHIREREIKPIP